MTVSLTAPEENVVRCFYGALENVLTINTVKCDYAIYNATGLLTHPDMLQAGVAYGTPWTRDAAINTWNCLRLFSPDVAKNTLFAVCKIDEAGAPVIQPDVQEWDQIIWVTGAWNYYLATGDEEFLHTAYGITKRALEKLHDTRFVPQYGLYRGGSFFNDGIAGYPKECYSDSDSSFAPDHPVVEQIMCLSTNCLYAEAWRIYSQMAEHFGDAALSEFAQKKHMALKETIHRTFWNDALGRYDYILFPDGHKDHSQEAAGHIFAVLFDICPRQQQASMLKNLTISSRGLVTIDPPFPGLFSEAFPGRHNNLIWPFLNGMFVQALAKCGLSEMAGREFENLTQLFADSDYHFSEIYNPYTGKPFGGWQLGKLWDSYPDQTWSATCYLGGLLFGILGIRTEKAGIRFAPCVPETLKTLKLEGLTIRSSDLTIQIHGWGTEIKSFTADKAPCAPFIPYDAKPHQIEITLC